MHALRNLLWPKPTRDETRDVELSGGCKAAALELHESQRDSARRGVVAVATAAAEQQPHHAGGSIGPPGQPPPVATAARHAPLQQPGSSMQQQQVHPGWALSAPGAARLVLSVFLEVAEQQQQEALLAACSWQAACECTQQLLLRPLLQHYLPASYLHLLVQQQQPEQQPEQQQAASHSTHELLAHLSLVVLLGEAVQLLTQPGCSAALKQLAANTLQQATDHPLLGPPSVVRSSSSNSSTAQAGILHQHFQAVVWPPLACWLRQLHSLAAADSQQGSHPTRLAWRQLAAALVQLQLQAQQASPPETQQPLPLVVLLQQLEGLPVPALLQAADLAAPLNLEQQHPPEQQLQLLLLIRLARTTASLVAQHACEGSSGAESSTVEHGPADDAAELQQLLLQAVRLLLAAVPATTAAAVVASLCDGGSSSSGGGVSAEPPSAFVRPCSSKAAVPTAAAAAADEAAADAAGLSSPRTSWPAELLSSAQLWPADDDGEDAEAITREERTLRAWINSLLHRGITGSSAAAGSPRAGGQAALLLSGPLRRGSSSGGGSGAVCSSSADDAGMGASDAALASWCAAEPAAPGTPRGSGGAAWQGSSNASSSRGAAAAGAPSIRSITSLFGPELRSGVLLLEILELLGGSVDWRSANRLPFNKRTAQLQSMENCSLALTIAMDQLGLPLVSMSPRDVVLGRRKVILSLTWQLMRFHTMQLLESISAVRQQEPAPSANQPGTPSVRQGGVNISSSSSSKQRRRLAISEQDILKRVNTKLQHVEGAPTLRSFKDPALASGVVLLQLLHSLAPALVDVAFTNPGVTPEQRLSNARYALSAMSQMGCSVFAVPEDIVDPPQPRMVLVLLASLMSWDLQQQQQQQLDRTGQQQ